MDLFNSFQHQVEKTNNTAFLIAFSGGLDSTALLTLFAKLRQNQPHLQLRAIHIHHGLSPNADNWANHCQHICQQFNIPFILEKVQLQRNSNIELQAREARYQAMKKHIQHNEILVTAHHLQDQTETFFLALKRGSGLQGLGAMQSQSQLWGMPIFRPLLNFSRQALEEYVTQTQLNWIEDESNQDNHYDRNFFRNQVLPQLRQRWAYWDENIQRSAQHCFEQQQLINELLADEMAKKSDKIDRTLDIADFKQQSLLKQKALFRLWLAENQLAMPTAVQLTQIIQDVIFAKEDTLPQFQLGQWLIRRYQNKLYLTPHFEDLRSSSLPIEQNQQIILPDQLGKLELIDQSNLFVFKWETAQGEIYQTELPSTNLPISIRFGYSGKVKIHPNRPSQDIKKIWQSLNIAPWQRQRIPLVFYANELKSAVGFFQVFTQS